MGWEDVDYCIRTFRAGRYCIYEPAAVAVHHESAIRGADVDERMRVWSTASRARLDEKYTDRDFAFFAHDAA
jgi:GT2 family glycosyltransferase